MLIKITCYRHATCIFSSHFSPVGGGSDADSLGYPMSQYVASISGHSLSYEAREMACHFADDYYNRLKGIIKIR